MATAETIDGASDSRLMLRVADGDVRAFEVVYDRYHMQAFGLAMGMTRQPAAAEDITQEAFLHLWRGAAGYEPSRGSLKSWLLQIVRNRGVDAHRRGRHHQRTLAIDDVRTEEAQAPERTDMTVIKRDESRDMRRLLTDLPIKQREVVELAYYKELTHAEVADDLGLPLGTVKGRLRLAHTKLHEALALQPE